MTNDPHCAVGPITLPQSFGRTRANGTSSAPSCQRRLPHTRRLERVALAKITANPIPQQLQRCHRKQTVTGPIELKLIEPLMQLPTNPDTRRDRRQANPDEQPDPTTRLHE